VQRREDHLELVLNRPHVRNALNRAMRDGLLEGLALAAADPTIVEVALRGEGPSFCSGGDLDEFGSFTDPASAHLVRLAASIGRSIDALGPRIVAHVHGPCAGSGVELPAFAGRVVARPDFSAALPEVGLGLIPGAGGTASITRRVGRHRMALLALSGARINAVTALAWGLVDAVTDGADQNT
jgi:enoyl-CoA hydratase/carnithine racemase